MDLNKTKVLLSDLRKAKNLTQSEVAAKLGVLAKTVSKWETGHGFPDIESVPKLAEILGVSAETLLSGSIKQNTEDKGNMKKIDFYVCPDCGNVVFQTGKGEVLCCGKKLQPLSVKEADEKHLAKIEQIEDDCFITFDHEMTKKHYISFVAGIKYDSVVITRLYPEQNAEARIPRAYGKRIIFYCTNHGLFEIKR